MWAMLYKIHEIINSLKKFEKIDIFTILLNIITLNIINLYIWNVYEISNIFKYRFQANYHLNKFAFKHN